MHGASASLPALSQMLFCSPTSYGRWLTHSCDCDRGLLTEAWFVITMSGLVNAIHGTPLIALGGSHYFDKSECAYECNTRPYNVMPAPPARHQ
jgi:hypothetical protein